MKITPQFLLTIAPGASMDIVNAIVANQDILTRYGITDATELAWYFGQSARETQGFTRLEENLTYTSTARLRQVWPTRFKSDADAAPYVRNPKALANLVYGGRYGNRIGTDDGWIYRGSGMGQTTFRDNYAAVGAAYVANPDLLRSFPTALEAFCVYWRDHKCVEFVKRADLVGLTKIIQGGSSGLADRKLFTDRGLRFIASGRVTDTTAPVQHPEWLRRGMTGPAVLQLQQKLQAAGYYVGGKLDSGFGEATEKAVAEFQNAQGLVADGVAGDRTVATLDIAAKVAKPASGAPTAPVDTVSGASEPGGLVGLLATLLGVLLKLLGKGR